MNTTKLTGDGKQAQIDALVHRFVNLGVGNQILYDNRLDEIIKVPDDHRFIVKFDDTGEKKIIGKKDSALDLIPEEQR